MLRAPFFLLAAPILFHAVLAATITYNWEATWVWAAPDGFGRPVIGINGSWPCPVIEASVGDTVIINLLNKLGNETTGLHFHGISQINTNFDDGAVGSNQCPLPPNYSMTYSFKLGHIGVGDILKYDSCGSYQLTSGQDHSHSMGQYPDGFRGPLIVHNVDDPYLDDYQADVLLTISDWYHAQSPKLVADMLQPNNTRFLPPFPDSVIINEGSNGHISVEPEKTYRIRLINFSAMTAAFVIFSALQMQVIMVDGTYVQKEAANQLRVLAGQRYDVLLTMGPSALQNYPYLIALDTNPDYSSLNSTVPIRYNHNFTGQLINDHKGNLKGESIVEAFYPADDSLMLPYDLEPVLGPVTKQWVLNFDFCQDENGYPRACFNDTTFIGQKVPTLYSVASLGENNTEVEAYGQVGAFTVGYGEVLEIVINNKDSAIHPFHLHGHQFQIIERPKSNKGSWSPTAARLIPSTPIRRDTVAVFANSHAILRIEATNPGVFLLHCHIEWHVEMGLTATLIEAPERLINYEIPQNHIDICAAQDIPTAGNAAGNELWSDTDGFVTINPTSYIGALYVDSETDTAAVATSTATVISTKTAAASASASADTQASSSKKRRQVKKFGHWLE